MVFLTLAPLFWISIISDEIFEDCPVSSFTFALYLGTCWTQPTAEEGCTTESVVIQVGCRKDVNESFRTSGMQLLKRTANTFWSYRLKKYLVYICPMKGGSVQNVIFYFFSAWANWPTYKISDFTDPPPTLCVFVDNFSNIWRQLPTQINQKKLQFCITKKRNGYFSIKRSVEWPLTFQHFKFPLLPLITHSAMKIWPLEKFQGESWTIKTLRLIFVVSGFDTWVRNYTGVRNYAAKIRRLKFISDLEFTNPAFQHPKVTSPLYDVLAHTNHTFSESSWSKADIIFVKFFTPAQFHKFCNLPEKRHVNCDISAS